MLVSCHLLDMQDSARKLSHADMLVSRFEMEIQFIFSHHLLILCKDMIEEELVQCVEDFWDKEYSRVGKQVVTPQRELNF